MALMRRMKGTRKERFWHNVQKGDECWEWLGYRNDAGYGILRTGPAGASRLERAHRISYELNIGPIPVGLDVGHQCDNPACVRPDHLVATTHDENMTQAKARRRMNRPPGDLRHRVPRGEALGGATKLTEAKVREIRALAPTHTYADLGRRYGVHESQIASIVKRKSWKHVE